MRTGLSRVIAVVGIALAVVGAMGTQAGAAGIAILQTEQNLLPPQHGSVSYAGGPSANALTVSTTGSSPNEDLVFSDPDVVIVAYRVSSKQNCTGGVGTATCDFARFLGIGGEDGDDVIDVSDVSPRLSELVVVDCGAGDDTAIVSTLIPTIVRPSCETVQTV